MTEPSQRGTVDLAPAAQSADGARGSALEVLLAFARLGCTSFGGPIAHLGYFRAEFVDRRRWLDEVLRRRAGVQRAMAGVNAAAVGVLGAALYDPVWTSAVHTRIDLAIALGAFGLLVYGKVSPFLVVGAAAIAGWLLT